MGSVTSLVEQGAYGVDTPDDITANRSFACLGQRPHRVGVSENFDGLFQFLEGPIRNQCGDMLMITSDETDYASARHRAQRFAPEVWAGGQFLQGHLVRRFAHITRVGRHGSGRQRRM